MYKYSWKRDLDISSCVIKSNSIFAQRDQFKDITCELDIRLEVSVMLETSSFDIEPTNWGMMMGLFHTNRYSVNYSLIGFTLDI